MAKQPQPVARKPLSIMPAERPLIDALRIYQPVGDLDVAPLIEASDLLKQLSTAVHATGRKGKLSINITLSPDGKNVAMEVECKPQIPKAKAVKRKVFVAENGELVTHDPDQYEFIDQLQKTPAPAPATEQLANA